MDDTPTIQLYIRTERTREMWQPANTDGWLYTDKEARILCRESRMCQDRRYEVVAVDGDGHGVVVDATHDTNIGQDYLDLVLDVVLSRNLVTGEGF